MSLYSTDTKINGMPGMVMRGMQNGAYVIVIERENATLEQIEAIDWSKPNIEGKTILPKGYSYKLESIAYSSCDHSYRVIVHVARQYLGDVTEYQERIDNLRQEKTDLSEQNATKQAKINNLEQQLAEADETAINLYERLAAKSAPEETEDETAVDLNEQPASDPAPVEAGDETGEEETA